MLGILIGLTVLVIAIAILVKVLLILGLDWLIGLLIVIWIGGLVLYGFGKLLTIAWYKLVEEPRQQTEAERIEKELQIEARRIEQERKESLAREIKELGDEIEAAKRGESQYTPTQLLEKVIRETRKWPGKPNENLPTKEEAEQQQRAYEWRAKRDAQKRITLSILREEASTNTTPENGTENQE